MSRYFRNTQRLFLFFHCGECVMRSTYLQKIAGQSCLPSINQQQVFVYHFHKPLWQFHPFHSHLKGQCRSRASNLHPWNKPPDLVLPAST